MKNSFVAGFVYFLLCSFFILGEFLPKKAYFLCFLYFLFTWMIRHFYRKNKPKDIELKDFIFAILFTVAILIIHILTNGELNGEQVVILFCISAIASVNFGCLLRYDILT